MPGLYALLGQGNNICHTQGDFKLNCGPSLFDIIMQSGNPEQLNGAFNTVNNK